MNRESCSISFSILCDKLFESFALKDLKKHEAQFQTFLSCKVRRDVTWTPLKEHFQRWEKLEM